MGSVRVPLAMIVSALPLQNKMISFLHLLLSEEKQNRYTEQVKRSCQPLLAAGDKHQTTEKRLDLRLWWVGSQIHTINVQDVVVRWIAERQGVLSRHR
jgi:hypothetical protein